jgi:hypothetical protein
VLQKCHTECQAVSSSVTKVSHMIRDMGQRSDIDVTAEPSCYISVTRSEGYGPEV